jgi:hypothetical protein
MAQGDIFEMICKQHDKPFCLTHIRSKNMLISFRALYRKLYTFLDTNPIVGAVFASTGAFALYFTMPTPSYYIFSIWVSCGLAVTWRARIANETALEFASLVFCVALVMAQVRGQVFARVDRS